MKSILVLTIALLSTTAFSETFLKYASGNFECTINSVSGKKFQVNTVRKMGAVKVSTKTEVEIENLDQTIAKAFQKSSSKDKAIDKYGYIYAGYNWISGIDDVYKVEFDLDVNDSSYATNLIFTLNHVCK